jgi:hypothetical protein
MTTVIEPIAAGLVVALVNKFLINNPIVWITVCGCGQDPREELHEDASSSTTSVNDVAATHHHIF